ncbi:LacI family DNA-binding transcriptional regulator [Halobacillus litoralis]|uniref:Catabolite control protein A n=1 Tax=Halobacillus litoralis TaxID=45668 RepID=A0A845F828_9BACI|nr:MULTISPECIES: LacI family DNA-binding transcriptional regulator [Halobacillus]MEC3885730.1 LacI family DNA-binding transcriptional regulator [Halobacillus sp. HZG1]MYL70472.1 LacI family DNA-binding transcriptional regulator [Halobacillus litoralis]
MVTIKDVAREAGVSVATVSRVLNDNGYVGADTRKKVMEAIAELNYSPNEVARSLYKRESRLIGLLLPDITNPFFPQLARGVEDELSEAGYRLLLGNSDENIQKELDYIQTFVQNNVVGIITATNHVDYKIYEALDLPLVLLDRASENYPAVYADGREGGLLAAKTLIKKGAQRITLVKGPTNIKPAQDRYKGAIEELSQADVDFSVLSTTSYSFEDAQGWAEELFDKFPDTDGIIASNDIVGIAIVHEALERGKRIPEDVQIIGYDDIPQSRLSYPTLSTIRQPAYEMGREAAKLLIRTIKKEPGVEQTIQMPVELVERKTTRKE